MNKRLVWNFEINSDNPLLLPDRDNIDQSELCWESRFFWPDDQIITLQGLNDHFLNLSAYKIKHRDDTYYLLPNADYNLKIRREQLVYKPLLMKKGQAIAFGKKIKLEEHPPGQPLPGCEDKEARTLIAQIKKQGIKIAVEKEALIYTFATTPISKLELAWLHVADKAYYSVNIESRSLQWVEAMTKQLLDHVLASDYVTFLKQMAK